MKCLHRNLSTIEALEQRQLLSGEPWGLYPRLIGQDRVAESYPWLNGSGMSVAVIDSGVDYNHPALGSGFGPGRKVVAGYDFISNDANPFCDTFAHGTGAAGIIAANPYVFKGQRYQGIAPGANIIAFRQNSEAGVRGALDWIAANRARYNIVAVNLVDFLTSPYGKSYTGQLSALADAGVFIASPLANQMNTAIEYPALDAHDYGVGGIGANDQIVWNSQRGPAMDIVAPADNVTLPYYDTNTGSHIYTDAADGNSWATPHVVGAAVLIKQINPGFTPDQVMSILRDSGQMRYDSVTGRSYPRLDLAAAVQLAMARGGNTVSPPPANIATQGSYRSSFAMSEIIQAEDFDNGGEGLAYHDTTATNEGGQYRSTAVDIETTTDAGGGHGVGYTHAGEFLEYTINVGAAGAYEFDARVASPLSGGAFQILVDGQAKTGSIAVPNTRGWQNWTTLSTGGIELSAGQHVLRVAMTGNNAWGFSGNFNWFRFQSSASGPASSPFYVAPVPGIVQAEDFDNGGEGVGYHDLDATNRGGQYRIAEGVDTERQADGAYTVGYLKAGEWMSYTINATAAGTFALDARVASAGAGGSFHVEIDGRIVATVTVPSTGSWNNFAIVTPATVSMSAGQHTVRLAMASNGATGYVGNIDWIRFR